MSDKVLKSVFIVLLSTIFLDCDLSRTRKNPIDKVAIELTEHIVIPYGRHKVRFFDGDILEVCATVEGAIKFDSIAIIRKAIQCDAKSIGCEKFTIEPFEILKGINADEYLKITSLQQRYKISLSDSEYIFFGRDTLSAHPLSKAFVSIYSLYNDHQHCCNVLVIDSLTSYDTRYLGRKIVFDDGDSMYIASNFFSDSLIDSIQVMEKTLSGKYIGCHRGDLRLYKCPILKVINRELWNEISSIMTAHRIFAGDSSYSISGKKGLGCNYPDSANVRLKMLILSLFSKKQHVSNVGIIDTIEW